MFDRLTASAGGVLARLAADSWLLFAVAVAGNAVLLPYQGLYHDAVLYAGQVQHTLDGSLGDDLFFKYGSQNRYTALPLILAPLAAVFGVGPVFFVAYLLANAARIGTTQLLVVRLVGRTPAAAAGVLLTAVVELPVAAAGAFAVNEGYFTARTPAFALAIFGLERTLAGKWRTAGGAFAAAAVLHPLVAGPAIGVAGLFLGGRHRRPAVLGFAGLLAAGVAYLIATAGTLDAEWRDLAAEFCGYLDPARWAPGDYLRLGLGGLIAGAFAWKSDEPGRRFVWAVVGVVVAGVAVAVLAANGTWALLYHVQAFRAVWPLELVRLPVGVALAARLWATPATRMPAVAVAAVTVGPPDLFAAGAVGWLAVGVLVGVVLERDPARPDWLPRAWAVGLVVWAVGLAVGVGPVRVAGLVEAPGFAALEWGRVVEQVGRGFGPAARLAVVLTAAGLLIRIAGRRATAVVVGVGLLATAAVVPVSRQFQPDAADVGFVAEVVAARTPAGRRPTVYWPVAPLAGVWFECRANAYFSTNQLGSATFVRACAMEAGRRRALVLPFEIDGYARKFGPDAARFVGVDVADFAGFPPPTAADVQRLAADPGVDFLVLPADFGGATATNSRVWVYDCGAIRKGFRRRAADRPVAADPRVAQ